jgi:hypothetical protein
MANRPTVLQRQLTQGGSDAGAAHGLGAWATDMRRAHQQGGHVRVPIHGMGAPVRLTIHRGIGRRRRRTRFHPRAHALPNFIKARTKAKEIERSSVRCDVPCPAYMDELAGKPICCPAPTNI